MPIGRKGPKRGIKGLSKRGGRGGASNKRSGGRGGTYPRQKLTMQRMPKGPFTHVNDYNPMPAQYMCKLVYVDDQTLTSSATQRSTGARNYYRLNTPYDPNPAIVVDPANTSAYGYSNVLNANLYQRYKVMGCKVDVTWYDPAVDGMAIVCSLGPVEADYDIASKDIRYLERQPNTTVSRINDSGSQKKRYVQYFPMNICYGITKEQFKADATLNTTAGYTTNPLWEPRFSLAVANNSTSEAKTINYRIKITYYTCCYNRFTTLN